MSSGGYTTSGKVVVNVRQAGPRAAILDIEGEVSAFAESALMDAYKRAGADGAEAVVLNFEKLDYMNSSGIGLLVTLLIRANRNGHRLLACGLSEHYQHIFELTRLNEAIRVYDGEAAALAAAGAY
ncbi:MAG: STAS domain-containing protein [Anaerolineae bacterium]